MKGKKNPDLQTCSIELTRGFMFKYFIAQIRPILLPKMEDFCIKMKFINIYQQTFA